MAGRRKSSMRMTGGGSDLSGASLQTGARTFLFLQTRIFEVRNGESKTKD